MDEPRRNDVFDRELRRALAADGGAAAGPHVDAELAAAWMDRQLDPLAARSIEAHLAGCQECQILMATLARMAPEAPTEGLAWWRRLRAGWLIPATVAAAAALVIWVAVPQQRRAAPAPAEQLPASAERRVETPPPPARPAEAPAPPGAAPSAAPAAAPEPPAGLSRRLAQRAPQDANEVEKKEADAAEAPTLERRERLADVQATPAPAAPPAPPPSAQAKALQESITITGESARENGRQDSADTTQRNLAAVAGAADGRLQSALVIAAPDGARWRRAGAAIEFAPRGGAFTVTTMPVTADAITAGAAPGGTVCWLAGTSGLVLVSVDGVRFTRVAAPVAASLIAIAAADARGAIVTAADGRRFRTTDQGASWSALP